MRIVRPGSVVGPQQQYMYLKQLEWAKWAAVDEIRKTQTSNPAASIPLVTPVTPPAEIDDEVDVMQMTPTRPTVPLPPVTPSRHVAAAAKATSVVPPGQPRKTPNAKRVAQDSDEEEADDVLPALGMAPVVRKIKTVPSRGITASDQRPMRVTRSTAGAAIIKKARMAPAPPPSPVKALRQGPNKIPRLATTRTTSAAKALAAANTPPIQSRPVRNVNPPSSSSNPSRLPMLIPSKRSQHTSSLSDVANLKRTATTTPDAWVANNVAAIVVPKSGRPGLRSVRRRRSSFSSADVIA